MAKRAVQVRNRCGRFLRDLLLASTITQTRAIQAPRNPELNHLGHLPQRASVADMRRNGDRQDVRN